MNSVPPGRPVGGTGQPYYRSGTPPIGRVQVHVPPRRRQPTPVRLLALVGFLVVTGLTFYLGLAVYQEADLGRRFFAGAVSLGEIQGADDQIVLLKQWQAISYLVSAAVVAVWSFFTVRNAAKRYPMGGHQPALTAVSWFVPIMHWFVPWNQLKKAAADGRGNSVGSLAMWQTFFVLQALAAYASRSAEKFLGNRNLASGDINTQDQIIDALRREGIYYLVVSGLFLLAVATAATAMAAVDRAASGADTA